MKNLKINIALMILKSFFFFSCSEMKHQQVELNENFKSGIELYDPASLRNCNEEFCQEGTGKYTYRDGSLYMGTFLNGMPEGNGVVYYANGNRYEGQWKANVPNGQGTMYYANGKQFDGSWNFGQPAAQAPKVQTEQFNPYSNTNTIKETISASLTGNNSDVKVWAVVVGVGHYKHMPTLQFTDDDAYQFYAFLKSPEGGAVADDQVRLLIDEKATSTNILSAAKSLFSQADENDVILFYFSGHGQQGNFLPVDFNGYTNKIDHETIKAIVNKSRAKYKFILADACHSGSLAAKGAATTIEKFYTAFESGQGGTACILSSKSEEYSLEDKGLRSGIFSYFLIKGLKGMADTNHNKVITVDELFNYVYQEVRTYTGNAQTPILAGNYAPETPVAVMN